VSAGTRVDDADALITTIPMPILGVDNMDEAAKMVTPLSDIVDMAQKIATDVKFEVPLCASVNVVRLYDIVDMAEKIAIDVKFEVIL
ncbi:hypothetical protein LSAT2_016106, partial [Lamellibrachia satsuma]